MSHTSEVKPTPSPIQIEPAWVAAVRLQQWARAATLFDGDATTMASLATNPELAYVRGRIASELKDYPQVVKLYAKLGDQLPTLSREIDTALAEAQLHTESYLAALPALTALQGIDGVLKQVSALRALNRGKEALALLDQTLATKKYRQKKLSATTQKHAARLRQARAQVLSELGEKSRAIDDLRFLANEVPGEPAASGADTRLAELGLPLSKQQRYKRAEQLTRRRAFEAVERELQLMRSAPGRAVAKVSVLRTRAWNYYKSRRDYKQAAALFEQAAQIDKTHREQDLFFAARALSRAHQDSVAIRRYQKLARAFPRSSYAGQARYRLASLHYGLGEFEHAIAAYSDYLKRYDRQGKARYGAQARYGRIIAQLALKQGKAALGDLERKIQHTKNGRHRAALKQLRGVALLQAKQRELAIETFREVLTERPLSFAAAASRSRLKQMQSPYSTLIPASPDESKQAPLDATLPPKAALLHRLGLDLDAEQVLHEQAREVRARYAPRGGEALCLLYGKLASAKRGYRHALSIVRERVLLREITAGTRWLWDCSYPRPYTEFVAASEREQQVPKGLVFAVMRQESAFQSTVSSHVGAVGLMQLMPNTAKHAAAEMGIAYERRSLVSPPYNIKLGSYYLGKMLRTFEHPALAAAAYNAGPAAVSRWLKGALGLPTDVFVARIPYDETRNYVRRVFGNWQRYRYVSGGASEVPELELTLPEPVELGPGAY